jgi:hypothetical protein
MSCHYQCPQRLEYPSLENQTGWPWAAFHEGLAQSQWCWAYNGCPVTDSQVFIVKGIQEFQGQAFMKPKHRDQIAKFIARAHPHELEPFREIGGSMEAFHRHI